MDPSIEMYELCKTFRKLPSEINSEDTDDIELLLIVHNAVNSHQAEKDKKATRKGGRDNLKAKHGGGNHR